jgi:hypothetical protein
LRRTRCSLAPDAERSPVSAAQDFSPAPHDGAPTLADTGANDPRLPDLMEIRGATEIAMQLVL